MFYRSHLQTTVFILLSAACPLGAPAQRVSPEVKAHIESILNSMPVAKEISQAVISPDGTQVAAISQGQISVSPVNGRGGHAVAVSARMPVREVAWSSDSKQLAFIADHPGAVPESDVYLVSANGGATKRLADLKGYVQSPSFSPDSKTVAVLFIEGMPRLAGPLMPETPLSGVIEEHIYEQRITIIDLASNALKQATPADVYVYEYDWLPDSSGWAVTAAHGSGDNNWWIARLYTASAQTGELHEIYKPKWQITQPRVSFDGKNIAFIEGLMSDEGLNGGDVFVIPTLGGEARNLTPGMKASASTLAWTATGTVTFGAYIDGESAIARVDLGGGDVKTLLHGPEFLTADSSGGSDTGISLSRDGSVIAAIRQSGSMPPEVWAGPIHDWQKITNLNAGLKPAWGEVRNVHWQNGDTRVQGWLFLPRNYDPQKKYPLVVTVHGGPSWACSNVWGGHHHGGELSAMGYFVLCPNPRGSFGQGEAFTQGNVKDFGNGDFKDIMTGIDALAAQYPVDEKRLGIHGHSYGGYMTMWAETQTDRFAAAVAGAGLSDWLSYYGQNDIDQWMVPFFGASVYDDPAVYAKSDPIKFVKNVKTPTLIIVGDSDGEVPMPQSLEWWHALKTLGVPTELVVYPNEGHAIGRDPANARDYTQRTMEWFAEWFAKVKE